jgi:hypothetical protein
VNIMDAYSDFLFFVPAVQSLHLHANGNKDKSKRYHYVFSRPSPLQSNLGVEWFKGSRTELVTTGSFLVPVSNARINNFDNFRQCRHMVYLFMGLF